MDTLDVCALAALVGHGLGAWGLWRLLAPARDPYPRGSVPLLLRRQERDARQERGMGQDRGVGQDKRRE